jgi:hypothetical protein
MLRLRLSFGCPGLGIALLMGIQWQMDGPKSMLYLQNGLIRLIIY